MDPVIGIIKRAKQGIDCSDAESAEIKGYVKETLIQVSTGQVEIIEDIQYYFPNEYSEAIDEMDMLSK